MLVLWMAGFLAFSPPTPLETARDLQDRPALEKLVNQYAAAAAKAPANADAQYHLALACSYQAEVAIELHDKKAGQQAALRGIAAGEKAVSLNGSSAEYLRVLGTLYGQAIVDIPSGLSYGAKAKDAINRAVEKAPKSSAVYVARGVGNYYLPAMLGGGPKPAIEDFKKAIQLDPNNAEAYLWLGVSLRKDNRDAEARKAFEKSLQFDPKRVWARQQLDKTPAK
ncbi:MAG TPA: tetratricopeptide repeat protein [Bryobacteraceae bacterium]|nr:tetratricopeptide repeat protein [Bryobacteraceae bacterium]